MPGHDALLSGIEDWLVDQALVDPDMRSLFGALCLRLVGAGVPVERAVVAWPTLHPLFLAEQLVWTRDGPLQVQRFDHSPGQHVGFQASPFGWMIRSGVDRFRRRLDGTDAQTDFGVLEDLVAGGFTDYVAAVKSFAVAQLQPGATFGYTGIVASWGTRRPGGFSDGDITALGRLMRPLSVAVRTALQSQLLRNLADAYLGPSIGEKVLAGAIRRGQGERLRAVIWYADLRGFTRLGQELAPDAYLAVLDRYYDATAGAVIAAGGEVLAFIGDAVLAVFPFGDDPAAAARAARAAADDALARGRAEPRRPFGIAIAAGEVTFGNVGVPERLNFTVIGEVVNMVQRIEAHTKLSGEAVLATAPVAEAEPERWRPLGPVALPDLSAPVALYALNPAT